MEDRLNTLKNLQKDWDDQGSNPPPEDLIQLAEKMVRLLKEKGIRDPDDLYALNDNEIFLEWFEKDPEQTVWRLILSLKQCCLWKSYQPLDKKRPVSEFMDLNGEPESWKLF